jgi:hypothetical protein
MKSFLVVEKGEQLFIKNLENELLEIKALVDKLNETVQLKNKNLEQLKSENLQIKERNQYLIENLTVVFKLSGTKL